MSVFGINFGGRSREEAFVMMYTSYHRFFVVIAFLFLLLTSSAANAVTINTSVDGTFAFWDGSAYSFEPLAGNQTATTGTITSNLWNDVVVPAYNSSSIPFKPYDQGDATAIASDAGNLCINALSQGYYGFDRSGRAGDVFHARSEWSDTVSGSGTLGFYISGGQIGLWNKTQGAASYSIGIVNNGITLWSSSASVHSSGIPMLTKTGVDLGGSTSDPSYSVFYYSFNDYEGGVDFSSGTLTYFMDVWVDANSGGDALIGDPLHPYDGGFSGEIEVTGPPVPVPCTILLLGSGLVGLAGLRRRFKK
jgi:hypothetical protein